MSKTEHNLHDGRRGTALAIRITLKGEKNEVTHVHADGTVRLKMTDQAMDKKANVNLVQYLAQILAVKPSQIEIVGGLESTDKLVAITGIEPETAQNLLLQQVG
jgi:uncharacterized protein YggU (UPF0235/DUF167 family)